MKLYFAGNFPLLKNPKREAAFINRATNRLWSFFYKDDVVLIIKHLKRKDRRKK